MITIQNYYEQIRKVDRSTLPEALSKMADLVDDVTDKGQSLDNYSADSDIKRTIDLYFQKLSEFLGTSKVQTVAKTTSSRPPKAAKFPVPKISKVAKTQAAPKQVKTIRKAHKAPMRVVKRSGDQVERISEELRFVKRFTLLNGKAKTRDQIRLFINALQRAMAEKRIRKNSPFADEIMDIQDSLLELFGKFRGKTNTVEVQISEQKLTHYLNIIGKQELLLSVRFIKSYIGLQGKRITNTSAKNLHNRLAKAIHDKRITTRDPYWREVELLLSNLKAFVKKNTDEGVLVVPTKELNGLQGIVSGMGSVGGLNGFDTPPRNMIMNSEDLVKLNFRKLGFTGKWLQLIGDPSPGFSAIVFGQPKFGKSYLCVEWAGYLARNHGNVLYVAKEEGLDDTLIAKLREKNVAHPNLHVSDYLPEPDELDDYDFVFMDSMNSLGITSEYMEDFESANPEISFIYISQVTKDGKARGTHEHLHNVDIVINVSEPGKAFQYGRYNQGGQINIFNNPQNN